MSIDTSLRVKVNKVGQRNVLKRSERIEKMKAEGKWKPDQGAVGIPKTRVPKVKVGR